MNMYKMDTKLKHCSISTKVRRFLPQGLLLSSCQKMKTVTKMMRSVNRGRGFILQILLFLLVLSCHSHVNALNDLDYGDYGGESWNIASVAPGKDKVLNIGGIFPMTGGWAGGKGCRPAVFMALQDVNRRPDILPGHRLNMIHNDSRCMPGLGMNVLYELLYKEPTKLMLLGPGCSVVSTFVGQAARMWNLIVLSYGSSSPALSDRQRFPTFFRTHPSATLHNPTRVKLFNKFGWTRIATIQETQEVFTSTIEDLEQRVKHAGIEIAVRTSFLTDPTNAVRNLQRQDARVIVGLFYEDMARRVFCEVYHQKLYGPKYVWFIIGWYPDNWWAEQDDSIDCTPEQMREALEGHITTEGLMLNPHANRTTISGKTASEFQRLLEQKIGGNNPLSVTGYVEAPLAYDAVWSLALALNQTQTRLERQGKSLEQFDYSNRDIMEAIYSAMNSTNFEGVSGQVAFNSEGDRIIGTQIEQMWNGTYVKIGIYNYGNDDLDWYKIDRWPEDNVPQDRTIIVNKLRTVSQGLFVAMCLLASIGIVVSVFLLIFNTLNQHKRYIKLSQPHINSVLLAGCIICFTCIFLQGLDGAYLDEGAFQIICQARVWVLCVGFTLAYGSMFSKVWTIYRLTTRRKKEIKPMRDWEMYLVLGIFLAMDVGLLTAWQVIDPLSRSLESFPHERPQHMEEDIEIKPQLEHCESQHMNIWLGVTFGYKGILLLFGILLAYETRNVKVKQINDSKFVGMSIYNVVVLCIITAPVTLIIGSHQDASFAFVAVAILLSSFLAMGLIFVPKILELKRNPLEGSESAALTDSNTSREEEERHQRLLQENDDLKQQIAEKEDKITDLNRRLQLKAQQRALYPPTTLEPSPSPVPSPRTADKTNHQGAPQPNHQVVTKINHQGAVTTNRQSAPPTTRHTVNFAVSSNSPSSETDIIGRFPNTHLHKPDPPRDPQRSPIIKHRPHSAPNSNSYNKEGPDLDQTLVNDNNSDSALPHSISTTKSSKTSALSEETYSESYC